MNIYISNIDAHLTDADLRTLFTPYGEVASAAIAMDGFTDKPRGFGYVEMPQEEEARAAIAALNGSDWNGKKITVEEAPDTVIRKGSYKVGTGPVHMRPSRRR